MRERIAANVALVGLHPCVHPLVTPQVGELGKATPAVRALVWFLFHVDGPVHPQADAVKKILATLVADECLLAPVYQLMPLEAGNAAVGFVALVAVQPLSSSIHLMYALVQLQTHPRHKELAALLADEVTRLVRAIVPGHVFNVFFTLRAFSQQDGNVSDLRHVESAHWIKAVCFSNSLLPMNLKVVQCHCFRFGELLIACFTAKTFGEGTS